jgi:hypothetical protein
MSDNITDFENLPADLWVETNGGVFLKAIYDRVDGKRVPPSWKRSEADLGLENVFYCDFGQFYVLIPGSMEKQGAPLITRAPHSMTAILVRALGVKEAEDLDKIVEKYKDELGLSTNPIPLQAELGFLRGK